MDPKKDVSFRLELLLPRRRLQSAKGGFIDTKGDGSISQ